MGFYESYRKLITSKKSDFSAALLNTKVVSAFTGFLIFDKVCAVVELTCLTNFRGFLSMFLKAIDCGAILLPKNEIKTQFGSGF